VTAYGKAVVSKITGKVKNGKINGNAIFCKKDYYGKKAKTKTSKALQREDIK
jgi:hypothetical protein